MAVQTIDVSVTDRLGQALVTPDGRAQARPLALVTGEIPSAAASVQALRALGRPTRNGVSAFLHGHAGSGDGGHDAFVWDATATAADDGATVIAPAAGGDGRWKRLFRGAVDVRWFGAKGDGVSDDSTALNAAATAARAGGYGRLHLGAGTFKITTAVDFSDLAIDGAGRHKTLIDATAITTGPCVKAHGAAAAHTTLAAAAAESDSVITVAAATGLAAGDLIILYDPTDFSFSPWRAYYRAGEFAEVQSISGNQLTLRRPLYASYAAGLQVHKVTPTFFAAEGLAIQAADDQAAYALEIRYGQGIELREVELRGSSNAALALFKCYDVTLVGVRAVAKHNESPFGTSYGLVIGNCQNIHVVGGRYHAYRHGVAIGGNEEMSVPNRNILIESARLSSQINRAADIHGNSEWIVYRNCTMEGGAMFSGNHTTYSGCRIWHLITNLPQTVPAGELLGFDHTIENCEIVGKSLNVSFAPILDISGNNLTLTEKTLKGGTLRFRGNRCHVLAGNLCTYAFQVRNRGCTAEIGIEVVGNVFSGATANTYKIAFFADVQSGSDFKRLEWRGNRGLNAGVDIRSCETIVARDFEASTAVDSSQKGFNALKFSYADISDAYVHDTYNAGIVLDKGSAAAAVIRVSDVHITNFCTTYNSSTFYRTGLTVRGDTVVLNGVVCGARGAQAATDIRVDTVATLQAFGVVGQITRNAVTSVAELNVQAGKLRLDGLPTAADGLTSGMVWKDAAAAGVLKVV